ncbi:P-loop containing nucleoside triphosphate hydrolase protein [Panus rudis PR-1116 ss-1]|nr:P-loop containing nucleoside triphosphate hydrolase protein [Panus rudis PR-1116 ss-1]
MVTTNPRIARLHKHFNSVVHGNTQLSPRDGKLFLEAISSQADPVSCVDKLVNSEKGLNAIQAAMRFDITTQFFNKEAQQFLQFISSPDIASVAGGAHLRAIVTSVVEPPVFWTPFHRAFQAGELTEATQVSFAWLLLQLIQLPRDMVEPYRTLLDSTTILHSLEGSQSYDVRTHAYAIRHAYSAQSIGTVPLDYGPGGRHDNDHVDFRDISILPTADEITCDKPAFLRRGADIEDPETAGTRVATHLDNQFRLLREDMLYELRDDLALAFRKKAGKYRGLSLKGLSLKDIHLTSAGKNCRWGLVFQCQHDFWQLAKAKDRRKHLNDNRNIFKHQSLACLHIDGTVVAFLTVHRDEDLLAKKPPVLVLQLEGQKDVGAVLLKLKMAKPADVGLLQIDTAVFAYQPILTALQSINNLPLDSELLFWSETSSPDSLPDYPARIVHAIRTSPMTDLKTLLGAPRSIKLDKPQSDSLILGLTQCLSLIQGPPGTGKSFIGALLAKILHDHTAQTILVVCYTNHALDQFLTDLLDIGIPSTSVVRLGGKSTPRTESLSIHNLMKGRGNSFRLGRDSHRQIDSLKSELTLLADQVQRNFRRLRDNNVQNTDLMEYLEFEDPDYHETFLVPQSSDGMQQVGKKGKDVKADYLLERWMNGQDAGMFQKANNVRAEPDIWAAGRTERDARMAQWKEAILREQIDNFCDAAQRYNRCLADIDRKFGESSGALIRSKRIIGCTTTAAAKYREDLQAAQADVLLVEEAGEILESHILTALGPQTKQLILIGDHQQLRPKVNNYLLTVEKGEGYDLNQSLFERMVIKGYPHSTLQAQHRMRPEIASLVRGLTYPDLRDAPGTHNRPTLRGVRDTVVFINHSKPEDDVAEVEEHRDMSAKSSKVNSHEVEMVLKIVKYLGQQGYGSDKIVILTPYLGQLRQLQLSLRETNDPVLNDLDSHDLVRAGLITPSAARLTRKPIRLATIDNYQGEESDIVIASLTRSNSTHDIGFMSSRERLTVLLSRARDAFIMIGNAETFTRARKGKEVWAKLFEIMKSSGHMYEGLPVCCEKHPNRHSLLKSPEDFDAECPDGGCLEPCGVMLSCNVHRCPSKCHQLSDHSKMQCSVPMYTPCPNGHQQRWLCHTGIPLVCATCDREAKLTEKQRAQDFARQQKRDAEQREHDRKLAEIDAQIQRYRDSLRDEQLAEERKQALEQKVKDLRAAAEFVTKAKTQAKTQYQAVSSNSSVSLATSSVQPNPPSSPQSPIASPGTTSSKNNAAGPTQMGHKETLPKSEKSKSQSIIVQTSRSKIEWQKQKMMEGAVNEAIDDIMAMTGLEEVKQQVLKIKAKVDTTQRQNASLKGERFNISMLGNPGTGKTTVARHYAKFLALVQVLPGNIFIETTGSRLANDGVPEAKKQIDTILKGGGGVLFVDEAYQLTNGNSYQGGQVLDFLLAEMENQVGKIVFIFAGYNSEMEKFFEHNPGLHSRVPYRLQFHDYEDSELLSMLEGLIHKTWGGKMMVDDPDSEGIRGLYGRIAIRRLGRGRGRDGFGNARALQNLFSRIRERQADRMVKERREGKRPDDFLIVKEDLIGPDPSRVIVESKTYKKLQGLIGLGSVKQSVESMFDMIKLNYQRELLEKSPMQMSLNRVFFGNPGTGKTTVAKLYGQLLAEMGLLSNGEVIIKNPADFVGAALGQSESQTKAILANTVGKVLIIDEAYMLYGGAANGESKGTADPYKTAVIDTIVAEVQSVPGEDRCVLLLGYKPQMEEMFQNVNPGLARRFAIEDAFHFEDYTEDELLQALDWKLKDQDLLATDAAKRVALDVLNRLRNRPNFGNIGEVENLLSKAKVQYQKRQSELPIQQRSPDAPFEPQDFDPDFNRHEHASSNLQKLFSDIVGCEKIIAKLSKYQKMASNLKNAGKDPRELIPTNFVFKGPPGTGKTTVARKMGQVYYDMGFLSSAEVVECSATDLVGQYVGHTGPKTKKLFEKALGRVLFIDEAYRLSEGHFAKEAMDEMVGILTQDRFRGKLIVILAGYEREMNKLLAVNTGLSSRFPEEINFHSMSPEQCLMVLRKDLDNQDIHIHALENSSGSEWEEMRDLLRQLIELPSWGNARDMKTLAKQIIGAAYASSGPLSFSDAAGASHAETLALEYIQSMLKERRARSGNVPSSKIQQREMPVLFDRPIQRPPPAEHTMATTQSKQAAPKPRIELRHASADEFGDGRDPDVSDAVWQELQSNKREAAEAERCVQEELQRREAELIEAAKREEQVRKELQQRVEEIARANLKDEAERARLMKEREQARLRQLAEKERQARLQAELDARRKVEEQRRKEESRVQAKIRKMGVCVAGFAWIKQGGGYRCAGGSHFLSNGQLGI